MSNAIEQAQARFDAAKAAYLDELERDSKRLDGSGAQERRREEHLQALKDAVDVAAHELELAKKANPGA